MAIRRQARSAPHASYEATVGPTGVCAVKDACKPYLQSHHFDERERTLSGPKPLDKDPMSGNKG